jgi:tRNA-2-methylthio-N6-dimethylallyladenosine synthase
MNTGVSTPPAAGPTIYLETFGCQMNVLDTQLVRGQLQALGYRFIEDWKTADVVLYNTCSVREQAENKVYSRIGEIGLLKRQRPEVVLGVLGCMAERDGADMARRHPQIDLLCGPGELDKVPLLLDNALRTSLEFRGGKAAVRTALRGNTQRRSQTLESAADNLELLDLSRSFDPDEHQGSAYVRITRGCNKFCSYCIVPFTRGAEVHRPPDHIVAECRRLVDAGVSEVTLLGQTVNHYHFDHDAVEQVEGVQQPQVGSVVRGPRAGRAAPQAEGNVTTFAKLLARVHDEVPGLRRLRFVTNFPRDFGDDILRVMAARPRICRYLHLPVQSGSNRILGLMNRGYRVEEYRELLARIRAHLPTVEMASDLICGFPTETEDDHRQTMALLEEARFKNCFIFKYSPRPGTSADKTLPDDVPEADKRRRNNELLNLQARISAEVHRQYQGRLVPVLVQAVSPHAVEGRNSAFPRAVGSTTAVSLGWEKPARTTQLTGRTDGDLIVCFQGDQTLVGSIVDVRIERTAPLALFGTMVPRETASQAPALT